MNEIDHAIQELENYEVEIVPIAEGAERQSHDSSTKIGSGYEHLDFCIDGGFREGDFNIITGVPGEGKTTLCRMFTLNLAKKEIPSLWFSYEMTLSELWSSFEKMGAERDLISFAPVELDDDLEWMFRHIKKAQEEKGVKAVFIDTLGDVVKSVKSQQELSNYANYLAQICKDLRMYAIQNNLMIFAVAHAVKNTRSKSNETDNSDIANSNGIPAAATNIFHVWREQELKSRKGGGSSFDHFTKVKIGKSRRDGTKKGWQVKFKYNEGRLLQVEKIEFEEKSW